ncbi:zinc finger protein with KRAB and SCAN domains 2-like isoform X3 [Cetorhinus maximus]
MMSEVRSERGALWSDAETLALIAVWSEENVQTALDEQLRNSHVFKFISSQLLDQGYIRTPEQCRIRIKGLKRKYTLAKDSIKRGCSASGRKICRFYEQLDVVLGSRVANERPVLMDAIATTAPRVRRAHSSVPLNPQPKKAKKHSLEDIMDGMMEKFIRYSEAADEKFLRYMEASEERFARLEQLRMEMEERMRQSDREHEARVLFMLGQMMGHNMTDFPSTSSTAEGEITERKVF